MQTIAPMFYVRRTAAATTTTKVDTAFYNNNNCYAKQQQQHNALKHALHYANNNKNVALICNYNKYKNNTGTLKQQCQPQVTKENSFVRLLLVIAAPSC